MSMEEWPDDHLDELFRKSAEAFNVPYDPDNWTDLSRRLDEHDRHFLFDYISRWGGVGALLLLLLAGFGRVTPSTNPTASNQRIFLTTRPPVRLTSANAKVEKQPAQPPTQPEGNSRVANATPGNVPDPVTMTETTLTPTPISQRSEPSTHTPAEQATTKRNEQQATGSVAQQGVKPRKQPTGAFDGIKKVVADKAFIQPTTTGSGTLPTRPVVSGQPVTYLVSVGNVPETRGSEPASEPVSATRYVALPAVGEGVADERWLPALTPLASLSSMVQQVPQSINPSLPEPTTSAPVRKATPRLSGLSVLLFASPDLSGIGLINVDRPGSNAGLAVQYQITDRLSVNAGAMFSTKRYQTSASAYVWPSYAYMEVWPDEIAGVCKMIDVPVNVRYDWLLRPRGDGQAPARWFASAGLTSYFIQREVYSYEYANPADPRIKARGWDNRKAGRPGGSFGFSNLNISVGYEQPISPRLSWQVEPFMKVPLQQVGYFKVRLLSTGAFIGLRYRL